MRTLKILLVVLMLAICGMFVSAMPLSAAEPTKCDLASLLERANALKASGDTDKDLEVLSKLAEDIRQTVFACKGYRFEGTGAKTQFGPIEFAKGEWLLRITTKGEFTLSSQVLTGKCYYPNGFGQESMNNRFVSVESGEAEAGTIFRISSEGCKILFTARLLTASGAADPWVVTFELVS